MGLKPRFKGYRSGFEKRIREDLDKRGIKYGYETHKLRYEKSTCPCCGIVIKYGTYIPDFVFERTDTDALYVEGKGRFTSSDRSKMLRVREHNRASDIRFLFQRDQPIRTGSTTLYSTWAERHGFKYAIGERIPDHWLIPELSGNDVNKAYVETAGNQAKQEDVSLVKPKRTNGTKKKPKTKGGV